MRTQAAAAANVLSAILCLFLAGPVAAADKPDKAGNAPPSPVTFPTQVQTGNIFTVGEKVEIEASVAAGSSVDWKVTDWQGREVAAGSAAVAEGKVRIAPAISGKGYYSVFLTAKDGAEPKGENRTACAILPAFANAAAMTDSKFGVMTHFAQNMPTDFLPLLVKAGIMHVRDEQYWAAIEKAKGTYTYPSGLQAYMDELEKFAVSPLICMSFGNPAYDSQKGIPSYKLAPAAPEAYEGYANYCVEVLKHYGSQIQVAEIWNEYNGTYCAGKAAEDRPKHYTEMLKVAYAKIKAARPEVKVLGAATVKIPLPYLEKLFKAGVLPHMDALAVHPYMSPDEAERALARLVELVKKYNDGKSKPIWCTEYGFHQDHSPERQAGALHLVRMTVCMLTQPDVEKVYWYLARDYSPQFSTMGLVHEKSDPMGALTPVMAYPAYANLISLLYQTDYKQRLKTDTRTRLYQFDGKQRQIWVGWSNFEKAKLAITASGPVTLVDLVGGERVLAPQGGVVEVAMDEIPLYIVAKPGVVSAVRELPRMDEVLFDSENEFAGPEVVNSWSYLYCGNDKKGSKPYDPEQAKLMTWTASLGDWADTWTGPGKWYSAGASGLQPAGLDGGQGWAIRRWTSPMEGKVHILADIGTAAKGDGCGFKVFIDGKEAFSKLLPAKARDVISLEQTVSKGMRIDFVATPGPGVDTTFDSAGYRVQILTPAK